MISSVYTSNVQPDKIILVIRILLKNTINSIIILRLEVLLVVYFKLIVIKIINSITYDTIDNIVLLILL